MPVKASLGQQGQLVLIEEVLETMGTYCQHSLLSTEAGGVLIGHFPQDFHNITIVQCTTPQKTDRRSRHRFHRSAEGHLPLLHQAWEESDGALNYVGEWHTHPEKNPTPSGMDLKFWRDATSTFSYAGDQLMFIIVGTRTIRGWRMHKIHLQPELIFEIPSPSRRSKRRKAQHGKKNQ